MNSNKNHGNGALSHQELFEVARLEREQRLNPSRRDQGSNRPVATISLTRRFSTVHIVPAISTHSRSLAYRKTADSHIDRGRTPSLRIKNSHTSTPYPTTVASRRVVSVSSSRVPMRRPGIPIFDLGIPLEACSQLSVACIPTNSSRSGNGTPLHFASQGRKAMPTHAIPRHGELGRSYPFHYINPNLVNGAAGPGLCNTDPQKCVLHMNGTLALCSLSQPLQGTIPDENSERVQRFFHGPPTHIAASIRFFMMSDFMSRNFAGVSLQRILNKEVLLPSAVGSLEVDGNAVPGHEMRIMIALPGFCSATFANLTIQCDHGRLTLDGLLYNVAVLIQVFLNREKGHQYHPGYPNVTNPGYFFIKSLYRASGEDVWRTEVVLLTEA